MFKGVREERKVHGRRGVCYTHIKQRTLANKQPHTDPKIERNKEKNSESMRADA